MFIKIMTFGNCLSQEGNSTSSNSNDGGGVDDDCY
jgi:hypothetical protein